MKKTAYTFGGLIPAFLLTFNVGCSPRRNNTTAAAPVRDSAAPSVTPAPSPVPGQTVATGDANTETPNDEQSIRNFFKGHFKALNDGDISAYMATIDSASPIYDSTRTTLQSLASTYVLRYDLESLEVVSNNGKEADVRVIQTTKKVSGPAFQNNRLKAVHSLKRHGDSWLLNSSKVENVESLNG